MTSFGFSWNCIAENCHFLLICFVIPKIQYFHIVCTCILSCYLSSNIWVYWVSTIELLGPGQHSFTFWISYQKKIAIVWFSWTPIGEDGRLGLRREWEASASGIRPLKPPAPPCSAPAPAWMYHLPPTPLGSLTVSTWAPAPGWTCEHIILLPPHPAEHLHVSECIACPLSKPALIDASPMINHLLPAWTCQCQNIIYL